VQDTTSSSKRKQDVVAFVPPNWSKACITDQLLHKLESLHSKITKTHQMKGRIESGGHLEGWGVGPTFTARKSK
jgi:hypothetical protein